MTKKFNLLKYIKYAVGMIRICIAYLIAKLIKFNNKYKDVWLLSEREDEAEDNSYFLFKYIRENYSKKQVYYIVDFQSKAYKRIKKYGNIIHHNSFKHYIYYFTAKKHISAFQFFGVPDDPLIWKLESFGVFKKKRIFLQHGIIQSMLPFLYYKNTHYDLFICGAQPEYEYVKNNFGYPEANVHYTGLCRFDNLHRIAVKNQILIMPTWRMWIGMTSKCEITNDDRVRFLSTNYYKAYQSLLKNERLKNFLKKENIKLLFYPHPEMQKYIDLFECDTSYIQIVDRKNSNLQTLMRDSLLLITDYSSIAFDRAYIKRPLIYYQFDKDEYHKNHFKKGYFDAEIHGFGPVILEEDLLITEIIKLCEHNEMNRKYSERSKNFFPLRDKKNCQRIYELIENL